MSFFKRLKNKLEREMQRGTEVKEVETVDKKEPASKASLKPEGKLAVDVYKTNAKIAIQAAIAGIKIEDLDIYIKGDVVTIKGVRERPEEIDKKDFYYQECYWGKFSRQIILPEEVDPSRAEASIQDGILIIKVPRIEREKKRKITVKEK